MPTESFVDVFIFITYYDAIKRSSQRSLTMARNSSKLQKGDLEVLTTVNDIHNAKRYAIMGKFKGIRKEIILARIGEGDADPRSPETIETTAECVAKEILSLYGLNARLRRDKAKNSTPIKTRD
jgi:hypothetical protein